jgi:hypothetical protein
MCADGLQIFDLLFVRIFKLKLFSCFNEISNYAGNFNVSLEYGFYT